MAKQPTTNAITRKQLADAIDAYDDEIKTLNEGKSDTYKSYREQLEAGGIDGRRASAELAATKAAIARRRKLAADPTKVREKDDLTDEILDEILPSLTRARVGRAESITPNASKSGADSAKSTAPSITPKPADVSAPNLTHGGPNGGEGNAPALSAEPIDREEEGSPEAGHLSSGKRPEGEPVKPEAGAVSDVGAGESPATIPEPSSVSLGSVGSGGEETNPVLAADIVSKSDSQKHIVADLIPDASTKVSAEPAREGGSQDSQVVEDDAGDAVPPLGEARHLLDGLQSLEPEHTVHELRYEALRSSARPNSETHDGEPSGNLGTAAAPTAGEGGKVATDPAGFAPGSIRYETTPSVGVVWHEALRCFPEVSGKALAELHADIADREAHTPIVMQGNIVLDGRARYLISREVGFPYAVLEYAGDDPLADIINLNMASRKLNLVERQAIAKKLIKLAPDREADIVDLMDLEQMAEAAQ